MKNNNSSKAILSLKPPFPPPQTIPVYCACKKEAVEEFIRQYLHLYVFIWTIDKEEFWIYPIRIRRNKLIGYVWQGSKWKLKQIYLRQIDSFF